jgi:hypothetical protein
MEVSGQLNAPATLPPRKDPRYTLDSWIGGWVGPRAGLDMVVKRKILSPCQESNPRTSIPGFNSRRGKVENFSLRWATGWMIGVLGFHSRRWEFFSSPPRPERLWGPPSLLSNGYQGLFPLCTTARHCR